MSVAVEVPPTDCHWREKLDINSDEVCTVLPTSVQNCKLKANLSILKNEMLFIYISTNLMNLFKDKWLHNWISYPSNQFKQILETYMAYISPAHILRQSLQEKQQN